CPDRQQAKELIFSSISAYVHGQRSYCLKLSLLIQVLAEHQSKLPLIVKETAGRSGLPIV
ncbi:hypothetical protein L7F22_022081, partial [Adiantum nelumboides]|nr:hypothetical protein [Adiantum nelumboides]